MEERKVLVILPSQQDRDELSSLQEEGYDFDYIADDFWRTYEPAPKDFDAATYTSQCILRAKEGSADTVFYSDDLSSLVASAVSAYVGLPGPSIEAMFLANHKLYCRMAERDPIGFAGYLLDKDEWRRSVDFPCHVKPSSLSFSVLQATTRTTSELELAIDALRKNARDWERPFTDFYRRYVDTVRFPLASRDVFLIEEFVEGATQHTVEGWTDEQGRQSVWAVSDNNYWPESGSALDNNSIPSRLPPTAVQAICEVAFDTVSRIGLKSGFWNVELWVRPDGRIQVTEVNGRMVASMTRLYRAVFGMSQYSAALALACNRPIDLSADVPGDAQGVGAMFAISTAAQGHIRDLVRLDELPRSARMPGVLKLSLLYQPNAAIRWRQTGGKSCVARAWIVGKNYEEIEQMANEIRERLLKQI